MIIIYLLLPTYRYTKALGVDTKVNDIIFKVNSGKTYHSPLLNKKNIFLVRYHWESA